MKYIFIFVLCSVFFAHFTYINDKNFINRNFSVKGLIVEQAKIQQVSEQSMLELAFCESSFRYNAKGDSGYAYGIYQYHRSTFDRYSKMYGQKLDYKSSLDQSKLTAWIMKNHPEEMSAWTCSKKVGIIN